MTKKAQEAYIRGFCKAAEAYGVDPEQLMKVAALPQQYLAKNVLGNAIRASRVPAEAAAKSRTLLPFERLQALRERLAKRWRFLDEASIAAKAHYISNPPRILDDAIWSARRSTGNSAALTKLNKIQSRMQEMREAYPEGAATKMIFGGK